MLKPPVNGDFMNKSVVIISFSSRKGGNCEQISDFLASYIDKSVIKYQFSEISVQPCGACRYECFDKSKNCPYAEDSVWELLDSVCSSDAVYYVLPNYQDFPNANFFIYQERMQGYFSQYPQRRKQFRSVPKKYIVISNTGAEHLRSVLHRHSSEEPDILILSSRKFGLSSITQRITESHEAKAQIRSFVVEMSD